MDAQVRGGIKNGNHGLTAFRMIERVIREIRWRYRNDVPVIVRMDGGFFDRLADWLTCSISVRGMGGPRFSLLGAVFPGHGETSRVILNAPIDEFNGVGYD